MGDCFGLKVQNKCGERDEGEKCGNVEGDKGNDRVRIQMIMQHYISKQSFSTLNFEFLHISLSSRSAYYFR